MRKNRQFIYYGILAIASLSIVSGCYGRIVDHDADPVDWLAIVLASLFLIYSLIRVNNIL